MKPPFRRDKLINIYISPNFIRVLFLYAKVRECESEILINSLIFCPPEIVNLAKRGSDHRVIKKVRTTEMLH